MIEDAARQEDQIRLAVDGRVLDWRQGHEPHFNLDVSAGFEFHDRFGILTKLEDALEHCSYTEPVFPWRGRYFEVGIKADVLNQAEGSSGPECAPG